MKIDFAVDGPTETVASKTRLAGELHFDGVWAGEADHDAIVSATVAATVAATNGIGIDVGTRAVVAFARSPMSLALAANDLQVLTGGRFVLGLGSQVRAHLERRYHVASDRPAARMRELIAAMKAIWDAWATGERLNFRGEFFSHTLMTPAFTPPPHRFGRPQVALAATGPLMSKVAAECAYLILVHSLMSERYLRSTLVPQLRSTAVAAHRPDGIPEVAHKVLMATGHTKESLDAAVRGIRDVVAFYASTSAYSHVLAAHGWDGVQPELAQLARAGRWAEMGDVIDDEMLAVFALVGEPEVVGRAAVERFAGVVDRLVFRSAVPVADEDWATVLYQARAFDAAI